MRYEMKKTRILIIGMDNRGLKTHTLIPYDSAAFKIKTCTKYMPKLILDKSTMFF